MKGSYPKELLTSWEDVFKQGLLTFWIFLVLKESTLSIEEIKLKIKLFSKNTYDPAEQTLYRVLRKHTELGLTEYEEVASASGPNRKLYTLSKNGKSILFDFTSRNISLFHQDIIKKILKESK